MSNHLSQPAPLGSNHRVDAPRSIPPHLLVSFLGVAQHKSMSHAATVQCLPQSQMTQQMARLEGLLGAPLFQGAPGKLTLTELGQRLYDGVKDPLRDIQLGAAALMGPAMDAPIASDVPRINISLQIWGLAGLLQPYLNELRGLGAELNFVTSQEAQNTPPDVLCYLGKSALPGYECDALFGEEVIAVCGNRYPVPKDGFDTKSLMAEPLLSLAHPDHTQDWQGFLGIDPDTVLPGIDKAPYRSFSTYLKALRAGRGVGVGLAPLFAADVKAGVLQVASQRRVWRNRSVFLAIADGSPNKRYAEDFGNILQQAFLEIGNI